MQSITLALIRFPNDHARPTASFIGDDTSIPFVAVFTVLALGFSKLTLFCVLPQRNI